MKNDYIANNWLKERTSNLALTKIQEKGGAIAMDQSGRLLYRFSPNDPFLPSKDYRAVSQVFSNFLDEKVDLITFTKKTKGELEGDMLYVAPQDLKMISDTRFEPHIPMEFIEAENGLYHLNKYIPLHYIQLECKPNYPYHDEIHAIYALIMHLSNNDYQRAEWIINWLAYFFQGLTKSQVALVLRGDPGAGKRIFFEEIIKPIIGEAYTKTINDKTLNSQYLGGLVEDVLFFNLDEISVQKSRNASVKNFLKALVTNSTLTAEKKFKTISKETKIHGQVLITSNEPEVIEIEPNDRRYSVFNTAGNLRYVNFLGYGSYENLSSAINGELEAFACYLLNYTVDSTSANTALMTPEKQELINIYVQKQQKHSTAHLPKLSKLQKCIQGFAYAIRTKEYSYFEAIRFEAPELYNSVMSDLYNNLFRVSNLLPVFKAIHGNRLVKTTAELLKELQACDMYQFNTNNIVIVTIVDTTEECFNIFPYYPNHSMHTAM